MTISVSQLMLEAGQKARAASRRMAAASTAEKNKALLCLADLLEAKGQEIFEANKQDLAKALENGLKESFVDRLRVTEKVLQLMAEGARQTAALPDPVGEISEMRRRPSGIQVGRMRVPLGVLGIIYESRPNVTVDAACLAVKSGNACILRGGSLAYHSCAMIAELLADALEAKGFPREAVSMIESTDREATGELMKLRGIVDVLIPRGGAGLIQRCVRESLVPVIETGTGNCHIYVHESADFDKALNIIVNAKTQRVGVCNAAESLLVDRAVADAFLPAVVAVLHDHGVLMHGDEATCAACADAGLAEGDDYVAATEEDWGREYLALEMSVKVVASEDEAIAHINRYGTMHSEAIVAEDTDACERFLDAVDASAVYANASTRFTDGGEFGLGAEIGISTQKLHARGPFAAEALTTYKYKLRGTGQVRP